jgi:hypothetical protein
LLVDSRQRILGRSEDFPFAAVVFIIIELVIEEVKGGIDGKGILDVLLELLDLIGDTLHKVLKSSKLLDVFRVAFNLHVDLLETGHQLLSVDLSSLSNEFDLVIGDLDMLLSKSVSDLLTADSEDGDNDVVGDLRLKSLGLLLVECDIFPEEIDLRRVVIIVELLHYSHGIKLVLLVVLGVSLDVSVKRLNRLVKAAGQSLIEIVDPGILVWKLSLVLDIRVLRLVQGSRGGLEIGLHIGLEEMGKQLLLRGRDVLQVVNTFVEDVLHSLRNFSWVAAESGLTFSIESEINLEEGLGLLERVISLEIFLCEKYILDSV